MEPYCARRSLFCCCSLYHLSPFPWLSFCIPVFTLKGNQKICMKISRGRIFFLDAHAPARLVGTTKRTPGGSRSGLGTLLAALAWTSSSAVTSASLGGGGAGGAGGEALRSAPMLMFVVCEGGRVVRGGGHTDVSIGLSACLLSGVGGSSNFLPRKRG